MVAGTKGDFFGGYDHKADAGFVHVADHHIAPGKKQWTWGNHHFGYAWDRSLTDTDGPYIELMAGAYTDNQPDFSYLAPWETKTFTQTWYPIHSIGVPLVANVDLALSLHAEETGKAFFGIIATRSVDDVTVTIRTGSFELDRWNGMLTPSDPLVRGFSLPPGTSPNAVSVMVHSGGRLLIEYDPLRIVGAKAPSVSQEPVAPELIESIEDLYLTGLHLAQYRHATRAPEIYWQEALRRDSADSRSRNAMGLWHLSRGEFELAKENFEISISRLTTLNPNPYDGEPYYNLGVTLRYLNERSKAYDNFYKATWNAAWRGPAYFALAEIDAQQHDWNNALDHLQRSLRVEADNLNASNLLAYVTEQIGDAKAAEMICDQIASLDLLDVGARWRAGRPLANGQEILDFAFNLMRSGRDQEARAVLYSADGSSRDGSAPIILLALARLESRFDAKAEQTAYKQALGSSLDYCFPSRLEELVLLEETIVSHPQDGFTRYLLGNLLYDRRRHREAIAAWESAALLMPGHATLWRNLGIGYFNIQRATDSAVEAFNRAIDACPLDGRILYERDQLWKRIGVTPEKRLSELQKFPELLSRRDDLSVELAALFNQVGRPKDALSLLLGRRFQPWEGGEGLVLTQFVRARLLLGQRALREGDAKQALQQFRAALAPPDNLGEATHLLVNQANVYYWIGMTLHQLGDQTEAQSWWQRAAQYRGDFQQMKVQNISEMTYWVALSKNQLGDITGANQLFEAINAYSSELELTEPKSDYFATSLPTMLLFEDDLKQRQRIRASFLRAQALVGLHHLDKVEAELTQVLRWDVNHAAAADLFEQLRAPLFMTSEG